jgi:hypothetical protein
VSFWGPGRRDPGLCRRAARRPGGSTGVMRGDTGDLQAWAAGSAADVYSHCTDEQLFADRSKV